MLPSAEAVQGLLGGLLDRDYQNASKAVLNAIARPLNDGRVALRLQQFNEEADRLATAGQKLTPNNAVYAALLNDLVDAMKVNRALIDGAAPELQQSAINAAASIAGQLVVPSPGVRWNTPDPEAVARIVQIVDSPGWEQELDGFEDGVVERLNDVLIRGVVNGQNPRTTARQWTNMVQTLPRSTAEQILRSVQLTGYRTATTAMQVANADIIAYVVRIAVLDDRTCLACIGLHGSRLEVGETVVDHRNGRCTSVSVLKGATGQPTQTYFVEGEQVTISTGEDWLRAHSAAAQQQIMGPANYAAYSAGAVQLKDFAHHYDDKLFGDAITEASLKGLLGEAAKGYYQ